MKSNPKNKTKNENKNLKIKGITLVALVVTIVVLIILATISINIIFGEEGIVEKSRQAKQDMANAEVEEQEILAETTNTMEGYIAGERENEETNSETTKIIDGTERVIGTFWGKTLYRKSFTGITPSSSDATLLDVSELNIEKCVNIEGHTEQPSGNVPFGYSNASVSSFVNIWYDINNKVLKFVGSGGYVNIPYYVTIEYTKVEETEE